MANAEIARRVGMAPSAVLERIRKLEDRGIIRGYSAQLDPAALGFGMLAFILVRTTTGCWQEGTGEQIAQCPQVEEVHHVAGEDCFLVKVRVKDTQALGALLRDRFNGVSSVGATRTTIVLESVKESSAVPVGRATDRATDVASAGKS